MYSISPSHVSRIHQRSKHSSPTSDSGCIQLTNCSTKPGKYDEINIKALDTIKLAIEHMKPRLVVLENTSGLANFKKNQAHFNRVLRNITTAGPGYSVAYKIINMADYGVPQQRKRLIIIAARYAAKPTLRALFSLLTINRRGTPLPAFPKPLHGPDGSGLLPFISIGDALESLVRQGARAHKHRYHRPNEMPRIDGVPYDAYSKFVDCIMTSGVTSCHPNGKRAFTPLELALLQTLPFHHQLTGTWTDAIKQVGNMFPPLMAEQVYRVCAQTLEAFDHGLIGAEDELEDLDITLIEKGVMIPEPPSTSSSFIDLTGEFKQSEYPYRYLIPPQLSDAQHSGYSSLFAHRSLPGRPAPQERKDRAPRIIMNSDDEFSRTSPPPREKKPAPSKSRQERRFWEQFNGGLIDLSIEDDDDEKEKV
jgi:DNA (cytosine-5)-methyltransferase 1